MRRAAALALLSLGLAAPAAAGNFFRGMPEYSTSTIQITTATHQFKTASHIPSQTGPITRMTFTIRPKIKADGNMPSRLGVLRNYVSSTKRQGGVVVSSSPLTNPSMAVFKFTKEQREVWAELEAFDVGETYTLTVIDVDLEKRQAATNNSVDYSGWRNCSKSNECIAVLTPCMAADAINKKYKRDYQRWQNVEKLRVNCHGGLLTDDQLTNLVKRRELSIECIEQRCAVIEDGKLKP